MEKEIIKLTNDGGLLKKIIKIGEGTIFPKKNDLISGLYIL